MNTDDISEYERFYDFSNSDQKFEEHDIRELLKDSKYYGMLQVIEDQDSSEVSSDDDPVLKAARSATDEDGFQSTCSSYSIY